MMNTINRGSEWRKWDLHIHSPFTWVNNTFPHDASGQVGDSELDEFIDKIVDSGLSVIGLTNYFKFDNRDFRLKEKLSNRGIQTFLNLEVRLANINKSDEMIDYHIIFNPKLDDSLIENLLGSLKAKLGSTEKAFNQLTNDEIKNSAAINLDELLNKLNENGSGLNGNYITGFLSRGHGCATSESEKKTQTIYEDIARKTHILLHSSDKENNVINDREYWLKKSKYTRPLLQSSDSHNLGAIGSKYSWIKADTTFEGLRQILFEPESRVAICREKPERKSPYLVIDHVTFNEQAKGQSEVESVYLNPNLNTVIGGRSNGKSTFTNSIAKALKNSHFQPVSSSGKVMNSFSDADFKVYWQDKDDFDNNRPIEFIPQDYMITLAENDKARNKLIRSTIETDKDNYDLIQDYEQKAQSNQSNVRQLLDDLVLINKQLSELKAPEGDKEGITNQLKRIHELVKEQSDEADFSSEDQEAYIHAYENFKIWENKRRLSEENLHHISGLKDTSIKLNVDLTQTDDSIYNNRILNIIDNLTEEVNEKWKAQIDTLEVEQQSNLAEQQDKVSDIIKSSSYVNGQEHIKNNQVLKSLSEQQQTEMTKLEAFKEFEKNKENLEKQKQEKQAQILEEYSKFTKFQDDLKSNFKVKPNNGDIEIAIEFVDIPFENNIQYLRSNNADNMKFIHDFNQNRISVINNIFENSDLILNQGKTIDELRRDIFSQKWNTLSYVLKYENDDYLQMSQGKKAFVILTLILEFSRDKKPVIIDQPEDSLDNRSIYRELTKYLKTKKKERQIILVTHNPNVVVGADAENVIVANQNSSNEPNKNHVQFSYVNGALENTFDNESALAILDKKGIREHAIEILEGGKEAFRERENKYTSEAST